MSTKFFDAVRVAVLAAGAAGLMTVAVTTAAEAQDERVRWPVPISFSSSLTALGDTLPWVAEKLDAATDGRISFEVFEPGTMIPALGIFEGTSSGNVEAGYSWMGYEIGQVPASALFGAQPFGLTPHQYTAWFYHHGGKELVEELYEPFGVHPVFCGTISPEAAGWFTFPLESVDQLQGLKFRAAGLGGQVMEEVGANVTLLPGGELYQALETGVLDATEFSLPTVDEQLGFHQVAKFYHLPGWHQPSTSQYLYVNMDVWNDLEPATQQLIDMACMAGVTYAMSRAEALQGAVLNRFEDELGVTAVRLPDEILGELAAATEVVMQRNAEQDEMFAKVYESQQAFLDENQRWHELGYLPRDWRSTHGAAE